MICTSCGGEFPHHYHGCEKANYVYDDDGVHRERVLDRTLSILDRGTLLELGRRAFYAYSAGARDTQPFTFPEGWLFEFARMLIEEHDERNRKLR